MKQKIVIVLPILIATAFIVWLTLGYLGAWYLTSRHFRISEVSPAPFEVENVSLKSRDSLKISAWYIPKKSDKAVIILTGIGGHRGFCINRAWHYLNQEYSVLLPDLRGTGNSEGDLISFGWNERNDLHACYEFLKKKGFSKIAAHGSSLGAATILYSFNEDPSYYFIALESCYDNLDNAFKNRVSKFGLPEFAYLPLRYFVEKRIGTSPEKLRPEDFIRKVSCPVLIMAGDSEDQLRLKETQKLFENCSSPDKELYIFKGGKHEDFKEKFPEDYSGVLNSFLSRH